MRSGTDALTPPTDATVAAATSMSMPVVHQTDASLLEQLDVQ